MPRHQGLRVRLLCLARQVGFLFLAVVLDARDMALVARKPESVIHHSDQGSQGGFNRCKDAGPRPSTGSVDDA